MGRIRWKQEEAEEEEELAAGDTEIYQFKMEAQRKRGASSFAGVLMGVISAVGNRATWHRGTHRPRPPKPKRQRTTFELQSRSNRIA